MRQPVPRAGRLLDLAGLLVFLAGAAVYARAWVGMQRLQSFEPPPGGPPFAAMARFDYFWRLSRTGIGLMVAGGLVAVAAAVVARRLRKRSSGS